MVLIALVILSSCNDSIKKESGADKYTVTFVLDGGKPDIPPKPVRNGEKAEKPETDP